MNTKDLILSGIRNTFNFKGETNRKEYIIFSIFVVLFVFLFGFIIGLMEIVIEEILFFGDVNDSIVEFLVLFISLPLTISLLSLTIRRLRHIGLSVWFVIIFFFPVFYDLYLIKMNDVTFWYDKLINEGRSNIDLVLILINLIFFLFLCLKKKN